MKYENATLFRGLDKSDAEKALICMNAYEKSYIESEIVLLSGQKDVHPGVITEGHARAVMEDFFGRRFIISKLGPGDLIAEFLAFSPEASSPVTVECETPCTILYFDEKFFYGGCRENCFIHKKISANLLEQMSEKYFSLQKKLTISLMKTIREKFSFYVTSLPSKASDDGEIVTLPFDREQLADYLGVDRSALSRIMSKMRTENIIDYRKNIVKIKSRDGLSPF